MRTTLSLAGTADWAGAFLSTQFTTLLAAYARAPRRSRLDKCQSRPLQSEVERSCPSLSKIYASLGS
jgi:hypothetical protein